METFSHISFSVSDLAKSTQFYDTVLETIGLKRVYTGDVASGWGPTPDQEKFAVKKRVNNPNTPSKGFHVALFAVDKESVHAFYEAALKNGGVDNGPPGPRSEYGENYYAAFVVDPDGYEIEVKFGI